MKEGLLILIYLFSSLALLAQVPTQTIRGNIVDKDSQKPLIGASVELVDSESGIGTATDIDGNFEIPNVLVGRHRLKATYLGYEAFTSDNLVLNSAKELVLIIEMVETGIQGDVALVVARKFGNEPVNELALLSTRSFSVEETQRYAASANDPSRMALSFPGVQATRDARNDITIRGNSGIGLLWRLEGIDIPNPNHFARIGSSGGGITIFSISMLGQSDFSTGAFPALYGNALSGVFDMNFRVGNKQDREYTFRSGFLGLDFATEGPIKKGKSSYLFNYRYSTLAVLSKLGIRLVDEREDNIFQDISFKLHFTSDNNKQIVSLWGIGGLSEENYAAIDGIENWKTFNDYRSYEFDTKMSVGGVNHTFLINDQSFLRTSLAFMTQRIDFREDTLNNQLLPSTYNDQRYRNDRLVISSYYSRKLSPRSTLKGGLIFTNLDYDLKRDFLLENNYVPLIDGQGNSYIAQSYAALRWRPHNNWNLSGGLHLLYFKLNNEFSPEPRIAINFQINDNSGLSLGYGLHSRLVPLGNYFINVLNDNGELNQPNLDLGLMKAHHWVMGFSHSFHHSWRLQIEAYWQYLFNIPVAENIDDTFSLINAIDGYWDGALLSQGNGRNMGIDITLEKYFANGTFLIATTSIFDSKYQPLNGQSYSTQYDSGIASTLLGGKEWHTSLNSVLQIGLKLIYNGGQRITPVSSNARDPYNPTQPMLDLSQAFSLKVQDYFRPDLRLAFRKNNAKNAWYVALDIQNFIGRKNVDALEHKFDPELGEWTFNDQAGIIPVLSFQIDW